MQRIPTRIPGLDDLLGGGIVEGSLVTIVGPSGVGKTIFLFQSLYLEAKAGNSAIYLPFDEFPENIEWISASFRWPLREVQEQRKLVIYKLPPEEYEGFTPAHIKTLTAKLELVIKAVNAVKLGFDSFSTITEFLNDKNSVRTALRHLSRLAKKTGTVIYLTLHSADPFLPTVERFSDGVLELEFLRKGAGFTRIFRVKKLKATEFPLRYFLMTVAPGKGVEILREEEII